MLRGVTMTKIFISDFAGKQEIETVLLVKLINTMEGKDGKKYFNIILSDSSGEIESRLWQYSTEVESEITRGTFAQVKGKLNFYQGKKQFIISSITKVNQDQVDMDDFVMKAKADPEEMFKALTNIVEDLTDVYIKELLKNILGDAEISRRLKTWQAGKSIHHAYQSGLLEHILSCSQLGVILSKHYQVNVNYVVAGCILHDLCKIYELTDGVNVEYTEEGKLVGHLVKGLEIVDRFSYRIKNFPYQLKLHLKHILLAHHGEYEYGSPKIPQTSEAYLVHLIDLMDSKMGTLDLIKKTDSTTGTWSGYIKHLDRIVYKSELPFYPEYIEEEEEKLKKNPRSKSEVSPTTSLGKMLSGFKVSE